MKVLLTIDDSRLQADADRRRAIGTATAQATKLSVDAYGGPEYRVAEQIFRLADALTKITTAGAAVPGVQCQSQENNGGLISTAMLGSTFGCMMPDALEKLKQEAPRPSRSKVAT